MFDNKREKKYYAWGKSVEYMKASEKDIDIVYEIVNQTIHEVYPKYYPREVVDFFSELHAKPNIKRDVLNGYVGILLDNNTVVGTGSCIENHITRVYVLPKFQGKGYGSFIIQELEKEIFLNYDVIKIDASLPASALYEHKGYITEKHEKWACKNDVILVYEIMTKPIHTNIERGIS